MRAPKIWMIRNRCVFRVDTLWGRIEQMKPFARDARNYFRRYAAERKRFPHAKQTAGARNRGENRFGVERFDRAKIDNFDFKTFARELLGGGERFMQHCAVTHNCEIATFADDACFAGGQSFRW